MKKNKNRIRSGRALLCILLIVLVAGCGKQKTELKIETVKTEKIKESADVQKKETMFVHISGAVGKPGVYSFEQGERIFQMIAKAGGLLEHAAMDSINQAEKLEDGMKIIVLTKEEFLLQKQSTAASVTEKGNQKVNINQASAEQLMSLPGIGEGKARQIIEYREENGSFTKIEDIMKISGIKEHLFEKIKDAISVNE